MLKTRMIRCACTCDAGYVVRTTRVHLSRWGAPIAPCCMRPMQSDFDGAASPAGIDDVFAEMGAIAGEDAGAAKLAEIESRFVKIRQARGCMDCGRTHDRGFVMLLNVGRDGRTIVRGHFCASGCQAPIEQDAPGGTPRGFRLTRDHVSGQSGFSEIAGHGEGFGVGARS